MIKFLSVLLNSNESFNDFSIIILKDLLEEKKSNIKSKIISRGLLFKFIYSSIRIYKISSCNLSRTLNLNIF